MSGLFVPVVGPSGAGKDTLIAAARERFAGDDRFLFVRRMVTRPAGGNEDHDSIDVAGFDRMRRSGAFVLTWGAHGLFYGIPAEALAAAQAGRVVVANLSRGALTDARAAFPAVRIVNVTAPPAVLAARLSRRGRESRSEIETRLARPAPNAVTGPDVLTIENDGALEDAVETLCGLLLGFVERVEAAR